MSDINAEFCNRCQKVTPSRVVYHDCGTEFLCAVCGWQVDFLHNDDGPPEDCEDNGEPVGSCDECDTNLYGDEVFYVPGYGKLCSQCAWMAMNGGCE